MASHVPAFGRFVHFASPYESVIILSIGWSLPAPDKINNFGLSACASLSLHPRLLLRDSKPNRLAGLASNPVARVLPDLRWVAQVRKLLELVHCTLKTLRLVSSHCIYLLQRRDQRAPLLLVRRVAIIGLIPPDLLGPTFIDVLQPEVDVRSLHPE